MNSSQYRPTHLKGQSLVEFVMVMPVLLLILLGAFTVGLGIYQGANASMAVKTPVMQKIDLAKDPGDTTNQAKMLIQNYNSGSLQMGSAIDRARTVGTSNKTTVIIATKEFQPPVSFLPMVDFTVTQAINSDLLNANQATASPAATTLGAITYPAPVVPPLPDTVLAGTCPAPYIGILTDIFNKTGWSICQPGAENFAGGQTASNNVTFFKLTDPNSYY